MCHMVNFQPNYKCIKNESVQFLSPKYRFFDLNTAGRILSLEI